MRQSLDYAPFCRIVATLGANGLTDATGVVTAFGHHGSVLDAATGLQQKSERWYSPDLGRFISEDPIQDGSNWYAFAGNDPVNYADPSGLYQQGHPLGGGYSGNVTRQPTVSSGRIPATSVVNPFATTTFGGFVDAERGRQILGLGPAPKTVAPLPTPVEQFNRSLTHSSNLSTLTRTVDPLRSVVNQSQDARDYWSEVDRNSNTVVNIERLNSGDSVRAMGIFGYAIPSVAPSYRVTYGDGRSVIRLGGEPNTSEAITIPGVGTAAVKTGRPIVNAVREAAPTVLAKAKGFLDDALRYVKDKVGLSKEVQAEFPTGSFSITKQKLQTYPSGVPVPEGPFRLIEGTDYDAARQAKEIANNLLRDQYNLRGMGVDIHEVHPIKFGGSPTDFANKILLDEQIHRKTVTPWWNQLQREVQNK